jgi:hypothetical protein
MSVQIELVICFVLGLIYGMHYFLYSQHLTVLRRVDSHQAKQVSLPASSSLPRPVHKLLSWGSRGTYW